jgi:hypothetical protein
VTRITPIYDNAANMALQCTDWDCGAGAPNPKFAEGIENEHTKLAGCDKEFTTTNYQVRTTPRKEYGIASGTTVCPDEDMLDRMKRKVRVIKTVESLKTLEICNKANLADYEILSVVSFSRCASSVFVELCFWTWVISDFFFVVDKRAGGQLMLAVGDFSAGSLHRPNVSGQ